MIGLTSQAGRRLTAAGAILCGIGMTASPQPAHALGTGAAVGIGLGAFALGSVLASPYYYGYPGYYPGYYGYAPAYYPPAPAYYGYAPGPARSCWSPYY